MAATEEIRPIIIKKKKVIVGGGHHGGAWKVAYADFVTAMMAFFLLMWLLNATSEKQRKGLADYFNPALPISRTSAGGAGMLAGDTVFSEDTASGSAVEGVPPKPSHSDQGLALGDEAAAPDVPVDAPVGGAADAASGGNTTPGEAREGRVEPLNFGEGGLGAGGLSAGDIDRAGLEAAGIDITELDREIQNRERRTRAGDDAENAEILASEQAEQARLETVGARVAQAMIEAEDGALERHFFMRITPDGLVIEIIDAEDQPLFASASAEPAPILTLLIDVLVPVLAEITNDLAVVGHTDSVRFGGADYSNWELSADRANAARRLLTRRGLAEERIARVTGKAAVEPLVADPTAAQNRRIAITLLRNPAR